MIVFPMVGRSSRFRRAGYQQHKCQLEIQGVSLLALSVSGFLPVAEANGLLFVLLKEDGLADFVSQEMRSLGVTRFSIIELDAMTSGQAETVFRAIEAGKIGDYMPLTVFNVDTIRIGFSFPEFSLNDDSVGYLECFVGSGPNWSNVVVASPGSHKVIRTSEKMQESELCCTGLYHFRSAAHFVSAYRGYYPARSGRTSSSGESYVAPIYNHLIALGNGEVGVDIIDSNDVIFCGVPDEYHSLLADVPPRVQEVIRVLRRGGQVS